MTSWRMQRQQRGTLACWHIETPNAQLVLTEQGAQVLSYQCRGQAPLIWLSEQAAFKAGQSVRGGAPICWPWFGDLKRNPVAVQAQHAQPEQAPFHGLARTLPWQLQQVEEQSEALVLVFELPSQNLPDWPHGLHPQLEIRLDERLTLTLVTHNPDEQPLWLTQALHTYLAISDIHQVSVQGLEGCRYIETLDDWRECQQSGALSFAGETDRIYLDVPSTLELVDPQWQRRIHLQTEGSRSAIVWNPWIDKASRLSQFASDAWQRMLCIETANVLEDAVQLLPGQTTRLGISLWSEPLA